LFGTRGRDSLRWRVGGTSPVVRKQLDWSLASSAPEAPGSAVTETTDTTRCRERRLRSRRSSQSCACRLSSAICSCSHVQRQAIWRRSRSHSLRNRLHSTHTPAAPQQNRRQLVMTEQRGRERERARGVTSGERCGWRTSPRQRDHQQNRVRRCLHRQATAYRPLASLPARVWPTTTSTSSPPAACSLAPLAAAAAPGQRNCSPFLPADAVVAAAVDDVAAPSHGRHRCRATLPLPLLPFLRPCCRSRCLHCSMHSPGQPPPPLL
jgi:hypothetical protein